MECVLLSNMKAVSGEGFQGITEATRNRRKTKSGTW
jgi:hypothetical protein